MNNENAITPVTNTELATATSLTALAEQGLFDIRLNKDDLAAVAVQARVDKLNKEIKALKSELKEKNAAQADKLQAFHTKWVETIKAIEGKVAKALSEFMPESELENICLADSQGYQLSAYPVRDMNESFFTKSKFTNFKIQIGGRAGRNGYYNSVMALKPELCAELEPMVAAYAEENAGPLKEIKSLRRRIDTRESALYNISVYERKVKSELTKLAVLELSKRESGLVKLLGINCDPSLSEDEDLDGEDEE